jgi:hypothetical protein
MKELIKPNLAEEEENPELDYYCETRDSCSCSWLSRNNSNTSDDSDDEIVF